MKYSLTEHDGFSLATILVPQLPTVTAYITADIHESQNANVRATELVYTDMLLSGAGKYSREAFLDAVNQLGASIAVSISDSVFTISLRTKSDVFKKVLSLSEIMLQSPRFDAKELVRVKQTVIGVIKESREDSRAIAHENLRNALYGSGDRRISPDEDKLIRAVKSVTKADLLKLHKKVHGCSLTCSIAGNKDVLQEFEKSVTRLTISTQRGVSKGTHTQFPPKKTLVVQNIPSRQNIDFSIGAPVPITLHHPDFLPFMFGLAVFGKWGGFAGRLMSTVREQEGLTYGIYAKTETFLNEEQGYWRIMTFFAPEKALQGVTSTFREIKKIYEHGITMEEFERFKNIIGTADTLKNDSTAALLGELHSYHMQRFSLEEIAKHKARMTGVTLDEVNAALRKYLNPATLTVSAAGPIKKVEKELKNFIK
jgi:zinc protease